MQLEIAYSRQDDRERAIKGWKKLAEKYPGNRELEIHLRRAYEWKEKEHTPEEMKCIEAEIEGWKELVMKHSDVSSLQTYLADAYAKLNDTDAQIEGWVELVNEFPKERELRDRLLYVLLQCESEDAALHALEELNWDPRNEDLEEMVKDMFNELK
jgi:tetratricopeptide (TPR) repeat protein